MIALSDGACAAAGRIFANGAAAGRAPDVAITVAKAVVASRKTSDCRMFLRQEVYGFRMPSVTGFDGSALGPGWGQKLLDLPHGVVDFHLERAFAELGRRRPGVP